MTDKKIVFFDIDGTIYSFDKGIPKDTKEAIQKLKKNGHIPVICTGRTRCMIYAEHLAAGFEHIVAGAGTYVEIKGKQSFLAEMEEKEARRVIDGFVECGFLPLGEGKEHLYIGTDESDLSEHNRHFLQVYREKIPERILSTNEADIRVSKVSGGFTGHSDEEKMTALFQEQYSVVNHNHHLLELIPKGYNKAKGIEKMIRQLDIPRENTYAFGDSMNDIDMLEYVKYGCAMGNSDEVVKKRCRYHTGEFDKGGILEGLQRFGLI